MVAVGVFFFGLLCFCLLACRCDIFHRYVTTRTELFENTYISHICPARDTPHYIPTRRAHPRRNPLNNPCICSADGSRVRRIDTCEVLGTQHLHPVRKSITHM